jgi:hypothetical protein
VTDHSVLDMSNEKDILPSVSGFVKQRLSTPSHLGDEYLARLWKSTLVRDLLWTTGEIFARPRKWRAPSWSWASISTGSFREKTLQMNEFIEEQFAEVSEDVCILAGPDPTGVLESGHLILTSPLVPATLHYWTLPEGYKRNRGNVSLIAYPQCRVVIDEVWYRVMLDYPVWEDGIGHVDDKTTVFLFLIGANRERWLPDFPHFGLSLQCLVLKSASGLEDAYERVGLVTVSAECVAHEPLIPSQTQEIDKDSDQMGRDPYGKTYSGHNAARRHKELND